jgi:hypothetical protein
MCCTSNGMWALRFVDPPTKGSEIILPPHDIWSCLTRGSPRDDHVALTCHLPCQPSSSLCSYQEPQPLFMPCFTDDLHAYCGSSLGSLPPLLLRAHRQIKSRRFRWAGLSLIHCATDWAGLQWVASNVPAQKLVDIGTPRKAQEDHSHRNPRNSAGAVSFTDSHSQPCTANERAPRELIHGFAPGRSTLATWNGSCQRSERPRPAVPTTQDLRCSRASSQYQARKAFLQRRVDLALPGYTDPAVPFR